MQTLTGEQKNITDIAKHIYTELRSEILNLTIAPGAAIIENDVCKRFNASRTPVREAFQRLQAAGLITTVPYQGSYASFLSMNQIRQYIYLRITVETSVLNDFILMATPFHIEELRYRINMQKALLSADVSPADFYVHDSAFHRVWFRKTGMELLWKTIQRALVHYRRFRMLDIVAVHNFAQIFSEHEQIFAAIENKNPEIVRELLQNHLYGGIRRLGDRISTEFSVYFIPEERELLVQLSKI